MFEDALVAYIEAKKIGVELQLCNFLLKSLVKGNQVIHRYLKEALGLFELMLDNEINPNIITCTILVDGFMKEGLIGEAFLFLDEVRRFDIVPNLYTYKAIINGLFKGNESVEIRNGQDMTVLSMNNNWEAQLSSFRDFRRIWSGCVVLSVTCSFMCLQLLLGDQVRISTGLFFYLTIQLGVHTSYPSEMAEERQRRRRPLEVPVSSTGSPRPQCVAELR
ncbi:hypothetical protein E2562_022951 [Oryza meyeriana var. granulata]|uniref:Pentatricopeptide repeat-containing protein n=1 Tax=Oryza meyeriana var. granulata TaxID=110450 RepID=A0A6G1D6V0_9ORYZ|nr:hypothetical protein E2562_022951 [Oryza meyeriana var. granulata]